LLVLGRLFASFVRARRDAPARLVPAGWLRWRFAVGVARIAFVAPSRRLRLVVGTGALGVGVSVALTLFAHAQAQLSELAVALLCGLLSIYAVLVVAVPRLRPAGLRGWSAAAVVLAGVVGTVVVVVVTAAQLPAGAVYNPILFSVVVAVVLTGYTVFAVTQPRPVAGDPAAALWGVGTGVGVR
jgi:uncharacterized membrane protein YhaH (DUF805 family)